MADVDFSEMRIVSRLPHHAFAANGGAVPRGLVGSKIVRFGTINDAAKADSHEIEGGGLVIDYCPPGFDSVRRIVFSFTEEGMWVVYHGGGYARGAQSRLRSKITRRSASSNEPR
jgi:hypothetical protein